MRLFAELEEVVAAVVQHAESSRARSGRTPAADRARRRTRRARRGTPRALGRAAPPDRRRPPGTGQWCDTGRTRASPSKNTDLSPVATISGLVPAPMRACSVERALDLARRRAAGSAPAYAAAGTARRPTPPAPSSRRSAGSATPASGSRCVQTRSNVRAADAMRDDADDEEQRRAPSTPDRDPAPRASRRRLGAIEQRRLRPGGERTGRRAPPPLPSRSPFRMAPQTGDVSSTSVTRNAAR